MTSSSQKKLPKKDRKAIAREVARLERERQAVVRRRNRRLAWTGVGTGVAVVVVIAVLVVQSQARAARFGPHNMISDGVVLSGDGSAITASRTSALAPDADPTPTVVDRTSGVVDLTVYADYRDPQAQQFWAANGESIESWVTSGYATLEIHPLADLDGADVSTADPSPSASATTATDSTDPSPLGTMTTTGDYSARAAGALACVGDAAPDSALVVHSALLTAQPDLTEAGLDDDELLALVQNAGVTDDEVADCVSGGDFADWAAEATARATADDLTSATVLVAGEIYSGALDDADALIAFIDEVSERLSAEAAAEVEATAEPTDEATDAADGTEETTEDTADQATEEPTTDGD